MASSKKIKHKTTPQLLAEVKKLQRKIISLSKSSTTNNISKNSLKEKWDLIFKHSENIIIVVDKEFNVIDINKTIKKNAKKEIIGKKFHAFHTEESKPIVKKALSKVFRNAKPEEYKVKAISLSGKLVNLACKATPLLENGKVKVAIIESIDITGKIETQNALIQSEEKFKKLSDAAFEGIAIHQNGKVVLVNKATCAIFNYTEKQIIGQPIFKFIHSDYHQFAIDKLKNKDEKPYEMIMLRKGKQPFWAKLMARELTHEGAPARVVVIRDISANKEAERKIKESERTLSVLMNNLPGMAYRCANDENWTMQFISNGCIDLTGYSPEILIGNKKKTFASIIHPNDRDIGIAEIKRALTTKTPFEIEYRIITKKGEEKWVWEKGEGVFAEDGAFLFLEGFITDINDKKRFEVEVSQSRENYKYLVDTSPDGVLIHIDGLIKFANPNALKLFGANSIHELGGKSVYDYVLPEYQKIVKDRLKITKDGEDLDFVEIKIKNIKGEIKEIESKPIPIKFNDEEAIQIVFKDLSIQKQLLKEQLRSQIAEETNKKLQQEIIERKNAEEELKRSEENYRDLFENATDFIQSIGIDGEIIYVNNAWKHALKYTDDDIKGKNIFDFIHPDSLDHCISIFQKIIAGQANDSIDVAFITQDGQKIICEGNVSCKYENGKVISTRGVFRDVTARKEAENKLREQSAKLNSIFNSGSHIIWTVDKSYRLTSYNKNFADHMLIHFGINVSIGLPMISEASEQTKEYNNFWVGKYNETLKGIPQYFETNRINKFGENVWREIYLNPIFDADGNVIEFSGISHDITEKKLSEERIQQSLKEKDVLLKEVHHRVKNNLQVISSILNLQSSYVKDQHTLNILKESQNRIKSMAFIHESLYQAKDLSSINFSEYASSLTHNLIHSYSSLSHEIKLSLDIQLIFLNLDLAIPCGLIINEIVSNSLKYAFIDNPPDAEVSIKMKTDGELVKLVIADNGIGLPKHINYRNTESLGLQLVVTLVDQLNGKIDIDTKKGTLYTIEFKQNQTKNRI